MNVLPELPLPDITVLAPQSLAPQLSLLDTRRYTYQPIVDTMTAEQGKWGHLRRLLWTQFQLPQHYRDRQAALLFSPVPEAPLWAGCRSVVMVHDLIPLRFPHWTSPLTPYFQYYVPRVLAQAQHIVCNSRATADEVITTYGLSPRHLTPIPLAHDTAHFRHLDLPTRNYFVYLGRSDPHKNVSRLLSAFAAVQPLGAYELWIVGPNDARYTPALMTQATELNIAPQVKWLDYVPYAELPRLLNQAIALVFPSLWEGFGLPVLEAMACGTPVITSNLSALPDVAGDAALLVNPYQVAEIAAAMQLVAKDEAARSHLRQAGLARARQFSWAKTGQATAEVLRVYLEQG